MYYVYCIENIVNGKLYIGKARNIKRRWSQHKSASNNLSITTIFYRALRKHGTANFKITTLDQDENEELCYKKEVEWILKLDSTNPDKGYNITAGGQGNSSMKLTKEQKKIRSEMSKLRYNSEVADRLRKAKGTEESKLNSSLASRGSGNGRAKLTNESVLEIRRLHETGSYTQLELGKMFNTPTVTINHVIRRYTWKHI